MSLRKVVVKEYLTTTQHGAICIFCKLQIRTNPERHQENGEGSGHALPDAHQFHHPPLRDGWDCVQGRGVIYTVSMKVRWILLNTTTPSARMNTAKPAV